jgi:hypothetical protein
MSEQAAWGDVRVSRDEGGVIVIAPVGVDAPERV